MAFRQTYQYEGKKPFAEEDNLSFYKGYHEGQKSIVLICEYKLIGVDEDDIALKEQEMLKLYTTIQKISKINHRNVSKIYDVIKTDYCLVVVQEDCTQGSLITILKNQKFIDQRFAMFITKEVAQGIQELHRNGIVHGYINLDNIELGIDGMWKISIRSLILKTFYLSPEFNLKYIKGIEGDIFSLGTAFYKMMFGIFPYSGKTKEQIISNIKNKQRRTETVLNSKLPFRIVISKNTQNLVFKMMQYKPEYRLQVSAVISQLAEYLLDNNNKTKKFPPQFEKDYFLFELTDPLSEMNYTNQQIMVAFEKKTREIRKIKLVGFDPNEGIEFEQYKRKKLQIYASDTPPSGFIQIKDIVQGRASVVIVYEYFNQGTLEDYLLKLKQGKKGETINEGKIEQIITSMCQSLSTLPEAHTWISNSRIFIKNGKGKIGQPAFETKEVRRRLQNSTNFIDELAPQKKSQSPPYTLQPTMDTWSVGAIYYKLLYGNSPQFNTNGALIFPSNVNIKQDQMTRLSYFLCLNPKYRKSLSQLNPSNPLSQDQSFSNIQMPSTLKTESKIRKSRSIRSPTKSISVKSQLPQQGDDNRYDKETSLQNIDDLKSHIRKQSNKTPTIQQKQDEDSQDDDCFEKSCLYLAGCFSLKHLSQAHFFQTLTTSWTHSIRYFLKLVFSFSLYIPLFYMAFFSVCGNLLVYRDFYQSTMITTRRSQYDSYPTVNYTVVTTNTSYFTQFYNTTLNTLKFDMNCARDNYYKASPQVYVNQYIKSTEFMAYEIIGFVIVMLHLLLKGIQIAKLDLASAMSQVDKNKDIKFSKVLSYVFTKMGLASLFSIHYLLYGSLYHMSLQPCLEKPLLPSVDRLFNGWASSFVLLYIWQYIGLIIAYSWIIYFTCFMKNKILPIYVWIILLILYVTGVGTRGMGGFVSSKSAYDTLVSLFGVFGELLELLTMAVCAIIDAIFWRAIRKTKAIKKSRINLMEESHATLDDTENNEAM